MEQPSPAPQAGLDEAILELQRQTERASLFTHTALSDGLTRLANTQVVVHALVALLLDKGLITEQQLEPALADSRHKLSSQGLLAGPGIAVRVDAEPEVPAVPVDCAARLHICHAVCCKLNFALSLAEVEAGRAKWDLGRPYFIRQGKDHYCAHLDRQTHGCGIYRDRPGVCRQYSCANDGRIWKDFEGMVLNDEWIGAHLSDAAAPRPHGTFMMDPI